MTTDPDAWKPASYVEAEKVFPGDLGAWINELRTYYDKPLSWEAIARQVRLHTRDFGTETNVSRPTVKAWWEAWKANQPIEGTG